MSWYEGAHNSVVEKHYIERLRETKGILDELQAQTWFSKFCEKNLFFTVRLLTGVELDAYQEIKLRGFFLRDFALNIEGRGVGKSFTISLFIILYAIFNPGCKIGICSGTFRQSKLIFKQIEKWISHSEGHYLKQCIGTIKHDPDGYEMQIGSSYVMAVPMTDKIRGLRFNKVIIDEYLLVPKEMVESVIRPFLTAKQSNSETDRIRRMEDSLIKEGKMEKSDRRKTKSNSIIALSSASFKFEDLYKDIFLKYCEKISDSRAEDVNHFVFRIGYEGVEGFGRMDTKLISEAKTTSSKAQFDREYRAIFTDQGTGYFNYQALEDATVGYGCHPMIKVRGEGGKKYILAIDPNYSLSETADNFAMAVLELNEEEKSGVLVHAYALANSKISKRADYLKYILSNFNIVYIILDNSGGPRFMSDAEEILGGFSKPLSILPNTLMDGPDGIREARKNYNFASGKIIHSQVFNKGDFIRLANEMLQANIQHKRLVFGGEIDDKEIGSSAAKILQMVKNQVIQVNNLEFRSDMDSVGDERVMDFIDHLNYLVRSTKKELTLIDESRGFNLPLDMKDTKNPTRVRRDSYTALLLANYGMNCYYEIMNYQVEQPIIMPVWIG